MNPTPAILLRIASNHTYFTDKSANKALQITTPLGESVPALSIQALADNFMIYGRDLTPQMIQHPIVIPFFATDPFFVNYTDLDLNLTPDANVNIKVSSNYPAKVLWLTSDLAEKGEIKADQTRVFPLHPDRFNVIIEKGNPALKVTKMELKSAYGTHYELVPPVGTTCDIDLTDKPKGRYNLVVGWEDGSEETYTFIALQYLPEQLPFALLRLYPEQLIAGYPDEVTGLSSPTYQISFPSRAVTWNYYLINISETDFNNATITASGAGAPEGSFLPQSGVRTLPNGTTAYLFSSDRPLPLRERYDFRLQLSVPGSMLGDVSLPFPNAANVQIVEATDDDTEPYTLFVEVFVQF